MSNYFENKHKKCIEKILLIDSKKYKEKELVEAIKEIQSTIKEKLPANKNLEDDISDFSMVILNLSDVMMEDNFEESVMARLLVENIWSDDDEDEDDSLEEEE
jgi:hypothetical protein